MPSNVPMTVKDFDADERWQAFATAYIENGGNSQEACRAAGFHQDTAARTKKQNSHFIEWLVEVVDRKMSAAINKADIRLANVVATGKPMDAAMRGTQKLLYERKAKLGAKLEIDATISRGEAVDMDVIKDLIDAGVAKVLRENAVAGKN